MSIMSSIMVPKVLRFHHQVFRFKETVEDFREHEEKLIAEKDRIQAFVEEMPLVNYDVLDWLEETQSVLEDVQRLKNEIEENTRRSTWKLNWIRQYCLSRNVVKKINAIRKLLAAQVDSDVFFPGIELLLNYEYDNLLYSSKPFNLAFEKIVEALKDDAVSMIAVWGMAAVGKTTLVREVGKTATALNFCLVIMVSVSCTPDLKKIQDAIAGSLSEVKNEKRILIILDDVWDGLDLKAIGIPHGEDHEGCKILLTTRCEQVCISISKGHST